MGSKSLHADIVLAWPTAEIAVMGAEAAVDILYHKNIEMNSVGYREEKIKEYSEQYINSRIALKEGYIDKEISPNNTREEIFNALKMLKGKNGGLQNLPKKHGNIPL